MAFLAQKKFMNRCFDNKMLGETEVTGCTYHGKAVGKPWKNECAVEQQCHAHLMRRLGHFSIGYDKVVMLDHIQDDDNGNARSTEEEKLFFLDWMMSHPVFGKSFLEHDPVKAYKERIMVRDVDTLPIYTFMFCIIATRAMWESYQNKIPGRMFRLHKLGLTKDFAFLMSHLFDVDSKVVLHDELYTSGHNCISKDRLTIGMVRNFLRNKTPGEGPDTPLKLSKGGFQRSMYGVFTLFGSSGVKVVDKYFGGEQPVDEYSWENAEPKSTKSDITLLLNAQRDLYED